MTSVLSEVFILYSFLKMHLHAQFLLLLLFFQCSNTLHLIRSDIIAKKGTYMVIQEKKQRFLEKFSFLFPEHSFCF